MYVVVTIFLVGGYILLLTLQNFKGMPNINFVGIMLLSLHHNITVHVENVVSLFSSPSTSSQKVRKRGGHKLVADLYISGT